MCSDDAEDQPVFHGHTRVVKGRKEFKKSIRF